MATAIKLTLVGTHSLIMHNVQLANPLNDFARAMKAITSKRKITDEDLERKLQYEFLGSLYYDKSAGVYVPGENIEACMVGAARLTRSGKLMEQALFIDSNVNPLIYDGPRTSEDLWADKNFRHDAMVRVQASRVLRCRPIFHKWSVVATATLDETILSVEEFKSIALTAGQRTGLGDYRPRYGRFQPTIEEV